MSQRGHRGTWRPKAPSGRSDQESSQSSRQYHVSSKRRKLNDENGNEKPLSSLGSGQIESATSQNRGQTFQSSRSSSTESNRISTPNFRGNRSRNHRKRGRESHNRTWNQDRRNKDESSSSSSSSTSSDSSSSSSESENDVLAAPAPSPAVAAPAPQPPLVPKKKLSEVKQVHGYYYDEMIDRYFRKPLPGAPGWTAYQSVMKRQQEMIEAEKTALEVEKRRLEKLATKTANLSVQEQFRGPPIAGDILYDKLDERSRLQPFQVSLQIREIESNRFSARARARALRTSIIRNTPPEYQCGSPFVNPASTCTDMTLIDPATLGLPVESDDDYQLRSALVLGTKHGHLSLFWANAKSPDEVNLVNVWTVLFANEGGISSVKSSPVSVDPPFVSCTTWGGNGVPGALRVISTSSQQQRKFTLRRGSAWCHEWQPHRTNYVSIGTETCALLVNVETNQTTKIFTAKSDVFAQQFDRAGRTLFNGTRDGKIKTYDVRKPPGSIPASGSHSEIMQHKSSISCMYLMKDENKLMSSSSEGAICIWERRMCRPLVNMKFANRFSLYHFSIDPTEHYVSVAASDGTLRIWDLSFHPTEEYLQPLVERRLPVQSTEHDWSSAVACCTDWMAMDGSHIYDPLVITLDGSSLLSTRISPRSR